MRLISDELLGRYLRREVSVDGTLYGVSVRYTGGKRLDVDEVEIGFSANGETRATVVYLPSVRDDGLLTWNHSLWYPVVLVAPPVMFRDQRSGLHSCLETLVNDAATARAIRDFLPRIANASFCDTPLYQELRKECSASLPELRDTSRWTAIDMPLAVIEIVNMKIVDDILRSRRPGFLGLNAVRAAVHSFVQASTQFHGDDPDEPDDLAFEDEEIEFLGRLAIEDRRNVLVIHDIVKETAVLENTPIDFCSCSSSKPMISARLKDGVSVEHGKFNGTATFPYARYRRGIVGILNDDPHRVVVSRAITRALALDDPDIPLVVTDTPLRDDAVCLPGVRMTHPGNFEDGIIVSKTFARKAGAYKVTSDRFTIPAGLGMIRREVSCANPDERRALARAARSGEEGSGFVHPGQVIASIVYRDLAGNQVLQEKRTRVKVPSVVIACDEFESVNDLGEDATTYRYVYLSYYPLAVGDKLSDAHGNKATVSAIVSDEIMPVWSDGSRDYRAHYIATPEVMKRLALGAEVEDKLGAMVLAGIVSGAYEHENGAYCIDTLSALSMDEVDRMMRDSGAAYLGTVTYQDAVYHDIPLSTRMMFRLDNIAEEMVTVRSGVVIDDGRRTSRNARLGLDMVTFLARGATNTVRHVLDRCGAKEVFENRVRNLVTAFESRIPDDAESFSVTTRLPREILGKPLGVDRVRELDLSGTVCDGRIRTMWGVIRFGRLTAVIPPHEPFEVPAPGMVRVSHLCVAANRFLAQAISAQRYRGVNVEGAWTRYRGTIVAALAGKKGAVRDSAMPVFPHTIRAVATPHMTENPAEIMLPKRAFGRLFASSEEIREAYRGKDPLCFLKRDPVHDVWNLVGARFALWERDTIGVHPVLMQSMDGDFDGDTLTAMFPTSSLAKDEIPLLFPKMQDIFEPRKRLSETSPALAHMTLMRMVGIGSSFEKPAPFDTLKNPALYEKLREGLDMSRGTSEMVRAARDFTVIKDGTASTGALSLRFIFTRTAEDAGILGDAMALYHVLAQSTLDAKSGVGVPALEVVSAFSRLTGLKVKSDPEYRSLQKTLSVALRAGTVTETAALEQLKRAGAGIRRKYEDGLRAALGATGFDRAPCIDEFVKFAVEVHEAGSMQAYLRKRCPVYACMQLGSGYEEIENLALVLSGSGLPGTVWESVLGHTTGISPSAIFDWKIRIEDTGRGLFRA